MTSKTRRLAFTAGFVVLFALTVWSWFPGAAAKDQAGSASATELTAPDSTAPGTPAELSDAASTTEPPPEVAAPVAPSQASDRQSYALGLHDIAGLAHDTPPGTIVDLWVAWDPPVTKRPQFQRLIPSVVIQEIIPPFVPEGPVTVMLSVPAKKIGDLLYADRYGAISVTLPQ